MLFIVLVISMVLYLIVFSIFLGCKTNKIRIGAAVATIVVGVVLFVTIFNLNRIYKNSYIRYEGEQIVRSSTIYDDDTIRRLVGEEHIDKPVTSLFEQLLSKF